MRLGGTPPHTWQVEGSVGLALAHAQPPVSGASDHPARPTSWLSQALRSPRPAQHTATLDRGLAGVSAPPSLPTHTCWLPLHSAFPQPKLRVPAPCRPT